MGQLLLWGSILGLCGIFVALKPGGQKNVCLVEQMPGPNAEPIGNLGAALRSRRRRVVAK
ncbi:hypothetical protein AYK59_20060 [Pseudomonas synxantha]|nr:hypothetical protein AYK59_20060 [Pseudomonas synxantha]